MVRERKRQRERRGAKKKGKETRECMQMQSPSRLQICKCCCLCDMQMRDYRALIRVKRTVHVNQGRMKKRSPLLLAPSPQPLPRISSAFVLKNGDMKKTNNERHVYKGQSTSIWITSMHPERAEVQVCFCGRTWLAFQYKHNRHT